MFDTVFGATLRLHITTIHPLLKYFNLEECRGEGGVTERSCRLQAKSHQSLQSLDPEPELLGRLKCNAVFRKRSFNGGL